MKNIRLIYSFVALLIIFISYAYSLTKADLLDLGPETKRISIFEGDTPEGLAQEFKDQN